MKFFLGCARLEDNINIFGGQKGFMEEKKDFDKWIGVKSDLHNSGIFRDIKEGEVWWCSIGANVGVEIDGKQELFLRPVLIVKKLSKFGFMGVPLTSQEHLGSWYVEFYFKDKRQFAVLAQARVMSVYRLHRIMGTVPNSDLKLVRDGFRKLYF